MHDFYRELCREKVWSVPYDVEYEQLPDGVKADNIAAAGRAGARSVTRNH